MTADATEAACPACGSSSVRKLVSRFARMRDEDSRVDEIADRLEGMGEPESPREMREMMREMGKAMDEDLSDDMEQMFEDDMEGGGEEDE